MPAKKKPASTTAKLIHSDPGLVAHCVPYEPFHFPGMATPPPPSLAIPALVESIQSRGSTIGRKRFEGHSETWAGILVKELIDWLAARAGEGSKHAQAGIADIARQAVSRHTWSLSEGHEPTLSRARTQPEIPGMVSLNPEHTAIWQAKLREAGQGSETPVPMERAPKAKRSTRDISAGKHRLVAALFDYISAYRRHTFIKAFEVPKDHPELHERIREMLALPEFGNDPKIITAWHKVAYQIVKESTAQAPETHPVFNRPPLDEMNRAHTRSSISTDLKTAWEALAREKSRIESGE